MNINDKNIAKAKVGREREREGAIIKQCIL
jgi:hypothetical protein